jgi:cytosine/adenosine deaminase-related metal-dependent hydrolase
VSGHSLIFDAQSGFILDITREAPPPDAQLLNAQGMLLLPGFVNLHLHATDTPFTRGLLEDARGANDHVGVYQVLPATRAATDAEAALAAAECTFAELLLSGCTTVVELGFDAEMRFGNAIEPTEWVADLAGRMGLRAWIGPRYRSARFALQPDGQLGYDRYADAGASRMADCVAFCEAWDGRYGGRLRTMLAPGQIDTCDPEMLRETRRIANRTGLAVQIHAGQSPTEFRSVVAQHGRSPIGLMDDTGLLGPDLLIGHGMFLSETGKVEEVPESELKALRGTGTTIAHLPWVKGRQGTAMQSMGQWIRAGVNLGLGTDTQPFDMVSELRTAATLCRLAERRIGAISAAEAYEAATIAGARALRRDDIGRLAPGCRADLVLLDIAVPHAVPMRDPVAHVVFNAQGADVRHVFVDGRQVVQDRRVLTTDLPAAMARLQAAAARVWERMGLTGADA